MVLIQRHYNERAAIKEEERSERNRGDGGRGDGDGGLKGAGQRARVERFSECCAGAKASAGCAGG